MSELFPDLPYASWHDTFVDDAGEIATDGRVTLTPADGESSEGTVFRGTVPLDKAGSFGYTVRVLPRHELLASPAELGLVVSA